MKFRKFTSAYNSLGSKQSQLKMYVSIVLLFFGFLMINAQNNHYYYYKGEKIPLILDKKHLSINVFQGSQTENILKDPSFKAIKKDIYLNIATKEKHLKPFKLEYQTAPTDDEFRQKLIELTSQKSVRNTSLFFKINDSLFIGTSNIFYVKLKHINDYPILQKIANEKNVEILDQNLYMPLWYKLRLKPYAIKPSVVVSNEFFETGLFANIDPAFMFNFSNKNITDIDSNEFFVTRRATENRASSSSAICANDTDFGLLWGLKNRSNSTIDINVCDAWRITEGDGINVAILDQEIYRDHPDLAPNMSPLSFSAEPGNPEMYTYANHGTFVAGVIGAVRNNNLDVVGVAPKSKLMGVSHSLISWAYSSEYFANGINWAWQNGADIINNSWGDQGGRYYNSFHSALLEDAIINALTEGRNGKGSVVIFAAGNNSGYIDYPASFNDDLIAVGSVMSTGLRNSHAGYGNDLDVVAPGDGIVSTTFHEGATAGIGGTTTGSGTSFATPYVSGIAALILSIDSSLSGKEVNDIIEQTAQKVGGYDYSIHENRPNGPWNNEMGYGLVDAYAAVLMAAQKHNSLDLYIKDSPDDIGEEPNTITGRRIWRSPDIWVRNRRDGIEEHQNPVYNRNNNRNYVYVRIRNRSNIASTGGDKVKLYWRKAGTVSRWPESWDGTTRQNGVLMGAPIGTIYIPALEPREEVVLSFPWEMPNPSDYSNISSSQSWHFCLLARIVSEDDPMTNEQEERYTSTNARKNNNIAWKNVTVVKASSRKRKCKKWDHCIVKKGEAQSDIRSFGGTISVGNPFDEAKTFSIELIKEESETGKAIFDEAEVSLEMNQTLYNAWKRGGKQSDLLNNTNDKKKKLVKGNHATLDNLRFAPNEMGTLNVSFNFLAKEFTDKSEFVYHVVQKEAETGEVIGGETYVINKDLQQVETERSVKEDRKLEIINNKTISIGKASFDKIIPNPASNTVRFTYNLGGAKSAYLTVTGFYHGATRTSTNYDLDINSRETTLDLTNYSGGHYQVTLVCDGKIVEAKTLIKE